MRTSMMFDRSANHDLQKYKCLANPELKQYIENHFLINKQNMKWKNHGNNLHCTRRYICVLVLSLPGLTITDLFLVYQQ